MSAGRATVAFLLAASLAMGCRAKDKDKDTASPDDDTAAIEDGSDTAAAETDSQLVTSSLVAATSPDSIGLASNDLSNADISVATVGEGVKAIYFPRNCLEVADNGDQTATYAFKGCIGPNGLRAVTGNLKVKYQADPASHSLHLELTATDLIVNKASMDWSATAVITADPSSANRQMTWTAQLSGTTARGRTFTRTNQHTITWALGESCFTLDGTSEGEVGVRQIHTQIEGFRRCRRSCPDANGKIVITNVTKNKTYELDYDGTDHATYTNPKGQSVSIPLLCSQ